MSQIEHIYLYASWILNLLSNILLTKTRSFSALFLLTVVSWCLSLSLKHNFLFLCMRGMCSGEHVIRGQRLSFCHVVPRLDPMFPGLEVNIFTCWALSRALALQLCYYFDHLRLSVEIFSIGLEIYICTSTSNKDLLLGLEKNCPKQELCSQN